MADDREPIDWTRVVIHGLFGIILGGIIGLAAWLKMDLLGGWGILVIIAPAAVVGVGGACWGDNFWEWLLGR